MRKFKETFDYYSNIIFTVLFIFLLSGVIYLVYTKTVKTDKKTNEIKETIVADKEEVKEIENIKVDIKGEVKRPSVYEISKDSNVSDLIKLAGGLTKNATTENINLSKKLEDQMVVKVFSKKELQKKENNSVSECVCKEVNIEKCENSTIVKQTGENINVDVINNKNTTSTNKLISINTATKEELTTLNSVGEAKALSIIAYRESNGPFKSIEEIKNVSGIGDALFEKIKDSITI